MRLTRRCETTKRTLNATKKQSTKVIIVLATRTENTKENTPHLCWTNENESIDQCTASERRDKEHGHAIGFRLRLFLLVCFVLFFLSVVHRVLLFQNGSRQINTDESAVPETDSPTAQAEKTKVNNRNAKKKPSQTRVSELVYHARAIGMRNVAIDAQRLHLYLAARQCDV
jgi:hypothetical protein